MKAFTIRTTVFSLLLMLVSSAAVAQAPQRMSYQAVIRNAEGTLLTSTAIGVKVSLLQGSDTGIAVYEETFTGTTNENGLLTLEIGGGSPILGSFAAVNWSTGIYYVKTETDPAGGTNYSITAVGQLLSVPYAFYSSSSSNQGKTTVILTGDITDAEAAAQLERELGPNTENVLINGTTQLTTITFIGVTNLVSIDINENEVLTSVNFPSLTKVFKDVSVTANLVLTSLTFPMLKNVYGSALTVNDNISLTSLDLSSLEQVSRGRLDLLSNHLLTEINLSALKKVQNLWIHDNTSMITLQLPQFQKCTGSTTITSNPILVSLNFNSLIESSFQIEDNQGLISINLPQCTIANIFNLTNCGALQSVSIPLLFSSYISLNNLVSLTTLNINAYNSGQLNINGTGINNLNLPNLHNPSIVSLVSNQQLVSVELAGLQTVQYSLNISQNEVLSSVVIPDNLSFEQPDPYAAINLQSNALTSTAVNNILHKLLTATPATGMSYRLNGQTPLAPPTGQGLVDKQTLNSMSNTVITD